MKEEINTSFNFEDSLKQLEEIVNSLESGNLSLDEALNRFETGIKLTRQAQQQLQQAEQRIQILLSENSDAKLTDFSISDEL